MKWFNALPADDQKAFGKFFNSSEHFPPEARGKDLARMMKEDCIAILGSALGASLYEELRPLKGKGAHGLVFEELLTHAQLPCLCQLPWEVQVFGFPPPPFSYHHIDVILAKLEAMDIDLKAVNSDLKAVEKAVNSDFTVVKSELKRVKETQEEERREKVSKQDVEETPSQSSTCPPSLCVGSYSNALYS